MALYRYALHNIHTWIRPPGIMNTTITIQISEDVMGRMQYYALLRIE